MLWPLLRKRQGVGTAQKGSRIGSTKDLTGEALRGRRLYYVWLAALVAVEMDKGVNEFLDLRLLPMQSGDFFEKPLDKHEKFGIIIKSSEGSKSEDSKMKRYCVMVAQQTLTLFVWVQILVPLPRLRPGALRFRA